MTRKRIRFDFLQAYTDPLGDVIDGVFIIDIQPQIVNQIDREVIYDIVSPNNDGRDCRLTIHFYKTYAQLEDIKWDDGTAEDCPCD